MITIIRLVKIIKTIYYLQKFKIDKIIINKLKKILGRLNKWNKK